MSFLWFILIGLVAGWLGGLIVRGSGAGFWINLLVGVVGAVLGGWIMSMLGASGDTLLWQLVVSVVGAVALLLIVGLFNRKRA
ncbi:MAG: GlsB/YeaQ/YmgE family stress response membrane protein [Alistipes sp.]|jgi:uncharacterized membrane protein YeaQ/YmgE (transglycosylase-associated protein family)|nr:GlsB/YeaQ/YmgE family stress response membrane protein [Alistipes sp.]